MRADRLVAIVLLLQTHRQLTAGQLAERLEASERTIRRDLDALSMAGVPVYAQRGRGGGWALLGGHRVDLSGLTVEEAQALFLVTGPGSVAGLGAGAMTLGPGLEAALRKLLAALPEQLRAHVVAAHRALLVDPTSWGGGSEPVPHLDALRRAVVDGVQVDISYARPGSEPEPRRLHPHGLVCKRGVWYLVATSPSGLRTYRVSRVRRAVPTNDPAQRPDGFDLGTEWRRVEDRLAVRAGTLPVTCAVDDQVRARFLTSIGAWWRIEDRQEERLTVWFPSAAVAARELAGFADAVHVLGPEVVRDELVALGRAMVARYGSEPVGVGPQR